MELPFDHTMSEKSLNQHQIVSFGLLLDGVWFFRLCDLLAYRSQLDTLAFLVAFDKRIRKSDAPDKKKQKGAKFYGYFKTQAEFYTSLFKNEITERCAYQIIEETTLAFYAFYIDVEWVGEIDTQHVYIQKIIEKVHGYYEEVQGTRKKLCMNVSCGSRGAKNSYHIVCPDILFDNNTDKHMESFAKKLMCTSLTSDTIDTELTDKIDTGVYNKNRVFRMPGACKRGDTVVLRRINSDSNEGLQNEYDEDSLENWKYSNLLVEKNDQDVFRFKHNIFKTVKKNTKEKTDLVATRKIKKSKITDDFSLCKDQKCRKIPLYFTRLFCSYGTQIDKIEYKAELPLPRSIDIFLQLKTTSTSCIEYYYITSPALCAKRFLCSERHTHVGNNAYMVMCNDSDNEDNTHIFVKCLCTYDAFHFKTDEFGVLSEIWPLLEKVVMCPFGVQTPPDHIMRKKKMTQHLTDASMFKRVMKQSIKDQVEWRKYMPDNGWVYIPSWLGLDLKPEIGIV